MDFFDETGFSLELRNSLKINGVPKLDMEDI